MCEAEVCSKVAELCTGKLRAVVGDDNIRNSMDSQNAFQFADEVASGLVVETTKFRPSRVVINHNEECFAVKFEQIHTKSCPWSLRKRGG